MNDKKSCRIDRPKNGTEVTISKIRGKLRIRKTANGVKIQFTASAKTEVRYLSRS